MQTSPESPAPPLRPDERVAWIADRPGYCVSTHGRVFSCRRRGEWVEMRPHRRSGKRVRSCVYLYHRDPAGRVVRDDVRVDLLVLEAFVGPRPPGQLPFHRDLNQSNHRLDNLEYRDNAFVGTAYAKRGSDATRAKVDEVQVVRLRVAVHNGDRDWAKWAAEFGMTEQGVKAIACGESWKHVDAGVPPWVKGPRVHPDAVRPFKLTPADKLEIRRRYLAGEPIPAIHALYQQVQRPYLSKFARGKAT